MSNYKELTLYQLTKEFSQSLQDSKVAENVSFHVYDSLLQEVLLDIIFEFHYSIKTGNYQFREDVSEDNSEFLVVNEPGLDVFGQHLLKKEQFCICPHLNCNKKLGATKFAGHLQKCMGLGNRQSQRLTQKGGTTNSNSSYASNGDGYDDDPIEVERKKPTRNSNSKKNSKNGRNSKAVRQSAIEAGQFSGLSEYASEKGDALEYMTNEEKRNMLRRICGVVSEHTKRLCTRSAQCPQHTQEQKRAVREALLDQYTELNGSDDSRGVSLSPADSGSNSNSSTTQGRKKDKPQRGRPPKTRRSSPNSPLI